MKYLPYHITHLNLDTPLKMPDFNKDNKGNYLVFWWNEIPLGQLFLKPGTRLIEKQYFEKVISSIKSGLNNYLKNNEDPKTEWEGYLLNKEFENWNAWMISIFNFSDRRNIPDKLSVSVIICTRNRPAYLKRCLTQLMKLTCLPEEIIVVDNAPPDDSTKNVVLQFTNIKYISEPRPGLDIARNSGITNATMPLVAFVDDDVEVHPLWVFRVWETFENPHVSAMAGLVIASELETEAQFIFENYWSFNRGFIDKIYDAKYFTETLSKGPPVWEIGAGANMAFRKNIFEKAGYFNELLDVGAAGCNGDSEMWFRILAKGNNIYYNPRAVVYHEHRKDINGLKKQIFYYMRGFAAAAMIQQNQEPEAGYKKLIFKKIPAYYRKLIIKGFPKYALNYRTLLVEIKGMISGLNYYYRNKKKIQNIKYR